VNLPALSDGDRVTLPPKAGSEQTGSAIPGLL
jgi:hypothetical protein